jgi:alkylation response protein AidB-like acyl-CoA dehydrogenase
MLRLVLLHIRVPTILSVRKKKDVVEGAVCWMEITDAHERALAFAKNDIPGLHLRLIAGKDYSDLIGRRKIASSSVCSRGNSKSHISLLRVRVPAKNLVGMKENRGVLVVGSDYSLQKIHRVASQI